MRDYGLEDWLLTVSRACHVDPQTLRLRHVNMTAAIMCLRSAGGPPVSADEKTDVADRLHRLLVGLVHLRPYIGGKHDIAAAAAARDFAGRLGYDLVLPDRGLTLVYMIETDGLDAADIRKCLRQALRPSAAGRRPEPQGLRGVNVCLSYAVSNPTPSLAPVIDYLQRRTTRALTLQGAHVRGPDPRPHVAADGSRDDRRGRSGQPVRTHELFTISVGRISWGHVVILFNDPQGQGSCVEREWALRLGIPVIELRLVRTVAPHQDGPGRVWTIDVDPARPQDALAALLVAVRRLTPAIRDAGAVAAALAVKNELPLAHLRGSWRALRKEERDAVSRATGMSRPYIDGLLHGPVSLELASDMQRSQLELVLFVQRTQAAALAGGVPAVSQRDLVLLADAAHDAGLRRLAAVQAIDHARGELSKSGARFGLPDLDAARALIEAAIDDLGLR